MKKVLALLLSAMMVMSLLTACGGTDGGAEVLKVWCPEEKQKITIAMCEAFKEAYPEFDITFEVVVVGIDESLIWTRPQNPRGAADNIKNDF